MEIKFHNSISCDFILMAYSSEWNVYDIQFEIVFSVQISFSFLLNYANQI
jgi:hypothetical protein